MKQKPHAPKRNPYEPAGFSSYEAYAMQAVAAGNANAHQQKTALDWIIRNLCGTYDLPFRPGGEEGRRDSDFACGKMYCGQQIVKLVNLSPSELSNLKESEDNARGNSKPTEHGT